MATQFLTTPRNAAPVEAGLNTPCHDEILDHLDTLDSIKEDDSATISHKLHVSAKTLIDTQPGRDLNPPKNQGKENPKFHASEDE
jgi:hypothetical protein